VPSNILFAMPASLNDSSKFSKEYAQIERFNKTLDASIGSIGYEDDEPLLSASARLSDANKSCSKYAFAFVYDSNASKWFEVCEYIFLVKEERTRSSLVMVIVRCEMQIERENPLRAKSVQKLPFCPAQNIKL